MLLLIYQVLIHFHIFIYIYEKTASSFHSIRLWSYLLSSYSVHQDDKTLSVAFSWFEILLCLCIEVNMKNFSWYLHFYCMLHKTIVLYLYALLILNGNCFSLRLIISHIVGNGMHYTLQPVSFLTNGHIHWIVDSLNHKLY